MGRHSGRRYYGPESVFPCAKREASSLLRRSVCGVYVKFIGNPEGLEHIYAFLYYGHIAVAAHYYADFSHLFLLADNCVHYNSKTSFGKQLFAKNLKI